MVPRSPAPTIATRTVSEPAACTAGGWIARPTPAAANALLNSLRDIESCPSAVMMTSRMAPRGCAQRAAVIMAHRDRSGLPSEQPSVPLPCGRPALLRPHGPHGEAPIGESVGTREALSDEPSRNRSFDVPRDRLRLFIHLIGAEGRLVPAEHV